MSESKKNKVVTDPFSDFKILKGEFTTPAGESTDDEIETGTTGLLEDEVDEKEAERLAAGDKALAELEKKKEEIAKAKKAKDEPNTDDEDEEGDDEGKLAEGAKAEETEETSLTRELVREMYNRGVLDFNDEDSDFEDSEEGVAKIMNKTVQSRIDKWASALPEDGVTFLEYLMNGGEPKKFHEVYYGNKNSWEGLELKDDDEDTQKLIVAEELKRQEHDAEEIKDMIEEWSDNGTLSKRAKTFLPRLQKHEAAQKIALVEERKKEVEKQRAAEAEYINTFKKTLESKDEVKGFKLTPKLKDKIWNHLMVVDKRTGKTGYQAAVEGDVEAIILFALQSAEGFDISKLETQVNSKISNKFGTMLRQSTKGTKEKISGGGTDETHYDSSPFKGFKSGLRP